MPRGSNTQNMSAVEMYDTYCKHGASWERDARGRLVLPAIPRCYSFAFFRNRVKLLALSALDAQENAFKCHSIIQQNGSDDISAHENIRIYNEWVRLYSQFRSELEA